MPILVFLVSVPLGMAARATDCVYSISQEISYLLLDDVSTLDSVDWSFLSLWVQSYSHDSAISVSWLNKVVHFRSLQSCSFTWSLEAVDHFLSIVLCSLHLRWFSISKASVVAFGLVVKSSSWIPIFFSQLLLFLCCVLADVMELVHLGHICWWIFLSDST